MCLLFVAAHSDHADAGLVLGCFMHEEVNQESADHAGRAGNGDRRPFERNPVDAGRFRDRFQVFLIELVFRPVHDAFHPSECVLACLSVLAYPSMS